MIRQDRLHFCRFHPLLLLFMLLLTWSSAVADERLLARFLEEAPTHWERYRELASRSEGTCRVAGWAVRDGQKTFTEEEYSFILDGEYARFIRRLHGEDAQECDCINPDYGFTVRSSDHGKWALVHLMVDKEMP